MPPSGGTGDEYTHPMPNRPALLALLVPGLAAAQPSPVLDLATIAPEDGIVRRVYGAEGEGNFGLPVAGGFDGDGIADDPGRLSR